MLANAKPGATFLLASPYSAADVWDHLPDELERQIIDKRIKFYVLDAVHLASAEFVREHGQEVVLASYDRQMLRAARLLGMATYAMRA